MVTAIERAGLIRIVAISGGAGFILAIAASHLLLHVHSAPEVGLGLVIGAASLALFGQRYSQCRAAEVWLSPLFVASVALVLVLHGRELQAERFFREIAHHLRIHCV